MHESLLSTKEVARILEVTQRTVQNLNHRGEFPNARKMNPEKTNSPLRIPATDLQDYLERIRPQ